MMKSNFKSFMFALEFIQQFRQTFENSSTFYLIFSILNLLGPLTSRFVNVALKSLPRPIRMLRLLVYEFT